MGPAIGITSLPDANNVPPIRGSGDKMEVYEG